MCSIFLQILAFLLGLDAPNLVRSLPHRKLLRDYNKPHKKVRKITKGLF